MTVFIRTFVNTSGLTGWAHCSNCALLYCLEYALADLHLDAVWNTFSVNVCVTKLQRQPPVAEKSFCCK